MRISFLFALAGLAAFATGCAGPERKLGRGMMNSAEIFRLGEVRRSIEQTALWENTESAYTTGLVRGLNRTAVRTGIGIYEILTFPIPSYEPLMVSSTRTYPDANMRNKTYPWGCMTLSEYPTYPDSYRPGLLSDSTFATDTSLGFSGGDVAPMIPGSRFRIFDN